MFGRYRHKILTYNRQGIVTIELHLVRNDFDAGIQPVTKTLQN
jgi:hypothetical protein